jgi:hypothetical protein
MGTYPPKTWEDVESYDGDDIVAGYREHTSGDPPPGPNRPPGYRWGWANARKDATGQEDGFEHVRAEGIAASRTPSPTIH